MLANAPHDQVACWERIPVDGQWYLIGQAVSEAIDPFEGSKGWPNLVGGSRHWKTIMFGPAENFAKLVRAFGIEPDCLFCTSPSSRAGFDAHCAAQQHYQSVCSLVDEGNGVEALWDTIQVLGGLIRFNHLTGELQVRRHLLDPEVPAAKPQDLPITGVWMMVGHPACVATRPGNEKDNWPNLRSLRDWKEKMERAVKHLVQIVVVCSGQYCSTCKFCPELCLSSEHLLGPKHARQLVEKIATFNNIVHITEFWQQWKLPTGAVAFNHANGTILMCHGPEELGDVPQIPTLPPTLSVSSVPLTATPPGITTTGPTVAAATTVGAAMPGCARNFTPPLQPTTAAAATANQVHGNPWQQAAPVLRSATVAATAIPVVCAKSINAMVEMPTASLPPVPPPPPVVPPKEVMARDGVVPHGVNLRAWLWEDHAVLPAFQLQRRLDVAAVPEGERICRLCGNTMFEGVAAHIVHNNGHLNQVEAFMATKGAEGPHWLQAWQRSSAGGGRAAIVQVNHLTLEIQDHSGGAPSGGHSDTADMRLVPQGNPTPATAAAGVAVPTAIPVGTAVATTGLQTVVQEPPGSGPVPGSLPPSESSAHIAGQHLAATNGADEWQTFQDPASGNPWYYNKRTEESRLTPPPVLVAMGKVCGEGT